MQDPFGRVNEVCDGCGLSGEANVVAVVTTQPKTTIDEISFTDHGTEFFCPICTDSNLHVATLMRTQVCCCKNCQGFLIDSETLGSLIMSLRASYAGADDQPQLIDQRELQKTIKCPTCLQTMFTHPYYGPGNAIINSCNVCHLNWFDAGELSAIIRAPGVR